MAIGIAISASLILAPMLMAGALFWTRVTIAVMFGGLALGLGIWARRKRKTAAFGLAGVAVVGAAAWTLVQSLPWPRALVASALPAAAESIDEVHALLGRAPPGWLALSLAPRDTRAELLTALAIAAAFSAGALGSVLGARSVILRGAALSAIVAAFVFLAHIATDASAVFGIYRPIHAASSPVAGPILNPNHLGGLLSFAAPLALGIALDGGGRERPSWLVAVVLLVGATLVTMSRGAILSLGAGLALMGVVFAVRRNKLRTARPDLVLGASAAALAGIALGLYVGLEQMTAIFPDEGVDKLDLALRGIELALLGPLTGYGRGAFSSAFVSMHGTSARFEHPENLVAQWTSEWGLVVGVVLLGALALAWLRSLRDARSFTRLGALAGLAALVVHDLVDFACEMPGIATVAAAVLGAVTVSAREGEPGRLVPGAGAIGLTSLAAAAVLAPVIGSTELETARGSIVAHIEAGELDAAASDAELALLAHPAEPTFALYRAHVAVARSEPNAGAWLNAAMRRAPQWAAPHVLAARWLIRRGAVSQSLLEIRESERLYPGHAGPLLCALVRSGVSARELARVAPPGSRDGFLDRAASCVPWDSDQAAALDAELADASLVGPNLRRARRALASGDLDGATRSVERARSIDRASEEATLVAVQIASRRGGPADAVAVLERAIEARGPTPPLLSALAEQQAAAGDAEAMRETVTRLRGRAAGSGPGIARTLVLLARLERSLGNRGQSIRAYEEAHRIDPASGALGALAQEAEQLGDRGRALAAYSEICAAEPGSNACAQRDRLRAAATQPMMPPR